MKHFLRGGLQGGVFGGLMAYIVFLSDFYRQENTFVSKAMEDISNVFLAPVFFFGVWGMSIITFLIITVIVYFILGALILGSYYKWRETTQPASWILKRFPLVLILLLIVAVSFITYNSRIEWGQLQIYLSCDKNYEIGSENCGDEGGVTCQELDQRKALLVQCLRDRGYQNESYLKDNGYLDKSHPLY